MLTHEGCLGRVDRLRKLLAAQGLEVAILSDSREVYYFSGLPLPSAADFPSLAVVPVDGPLTVFCPDGAEPLVADRVETYPWHIGYTRNLNNLRALTQLAGFVLREHRAATVGFQAESLPQWVGVELGTALRADTWYAIDDELADLQRAKDPDELVGLKRSIACDLAAYDAVQQAIAAGASELEVWSAGRAAAALAAGEPVYHDGDYQCCSLGGPPRERTCDAGELYVVDAWTVYRGYWSDLCRTFAVSAPTDLQQSVFDHLAGILCEVPARLKPGLQGTELWAWMDARIREHPHLADTGLIHHAGHGTGLRPHVGPDLNRDREGVLRVGDTVSVEPGAYSEELRAGIRLENAFLITAHGCELLSSYPLSLVRGSR